MTHAQASIELFKKEVHKIFAAHSLWLPTGVKVVVDEEKYGAYKRNLADMAMKIQAPDIDDKAKVKIIAEEIGALHSFIDKFRHKNSN